MDSYEEYKYYKKKYIKLRNKIISQKGGMYKCNPTAETLKQLCKKNKGGEYKTEPECLEGCSKQWRHHSKNISDTRENVVIQKPVEKEETKEETKKEEIRWYNGIIGIFNNTDDMIEYMKNNGKYDDWGNEIGIIDTRIKCTLWETLYGQVVGVNSVREYSPGMKISGAKFVPVTKFIGVATPGQCARPRSQGSDLSLNSIIIAKPNNVILSDYKYVHGTRKNFLRALSILNSGLKSGKTLGIRQSAAYGYYNKNSISVFPLDINNFNKGQLYGPFIFLINNKYRAIDASHLDKQLHEKYIVENIDPNDIILIISQKYNINLNSEEFSKSVNYFDNVTNKLSIDLLNIYNDMIYSLFEQKIDIDTFYNNNKMLDINIINNNFHKEILNLLPSGYQHKNLEWLINKCFKKEIIIIK